MTTNPEGMVVELKAAADVQPRGALRDVLQRAAVMVKYLSDQMKPKVDAKGRVTFLVTSGLGAKIGPFVQVQYAGEVTQMKPDHARALAFNLLACAEAAETDEALWSWAERNGLSVAELGRLLGDFRATREQRQAKEVETL